MRDIFVVVSDGHVGSTLGLVPGGGAALDDGGRYMPNVAQKWLGEQFADFLTQTDGMLKRGDRVHAVINGDAVDHISKGSQIWSRTDVDIVKAAVEVYQPLRDRVGNFFVIRGTEAHTGANGALEEAMALSLNATRWPLHSTTASTFYLQMKVQGLHLNFAHHGKAGRLTWTRMNPAGGMAAEAILNATENHTTIPDIIVRSHTHHWFDSHDNFPVRVIQTPAWQLQTSYGHRIAPGKNLHIGGMVLTIEDGVFDAKVFRYFTKGDEPWEPTTELQTPQTRRSSRQSKPQPAAAKMTMA